MLPDFRIRQRDYLLEIAQALTQELDLDKLLARILDISIEMLAGQGGLIALRSEHDDWQIRVSQHLNPAFQGILERYLSKIPAASLTADGEIREINYILTELTRAATMGQLTGLGLPLQTQQQVLGVIFIFRSYEGLMTPNDKVLLASFASQAAIAVQNAKYYSIVASEVQRLDALLDTAADGILILDSGTRISKCNRAFTRLFGGTQENIEGQYHREIIGWKKPPLGNTLEDSITSGWPITTHDNLYVEGDLKRNDPQPPLPIGITYAPLLSPNGDLINIIATVRDITRFRQTEELKSTFISIISHELKTPVALIKGYVSTLRREDANWDAAITKESLGVIEEEADHLSAMIENLLDASRLQAGGMALKKTDLYLPDMVKKLAEKFQVQTHDHTITYEFPENFPVILADENRIQQVVSNLIINALKYSPKGEIKISGQVRPDMVVITVSDEGPGIAAEDIPHVFDRFYRAPEMMKNTKGTGLGLFLSRSFIEAHNGRIWVDSQTNKGARICFSLPRN